MSDINEDFHVRNAEVNERLVRGIHLRSDILYFKDQAERLVAAAEAKAKAMVDPNQSAHDQEQKPVEQESQNEQ